MTGPAKALAPMHGGEPYSEEGQRLALAPHQIDERALALRSQLGKLLLTGTSEFKVIATAAGVPAERLVLELIGAARKKPEILQCTEDSIMTFMFDAAKLGLMIGRGVYPVAVNHGQGSQKVKRLEAWVGYYGAKELAISSGAIRDCWAMVVYEGDRFDMETAPVPRVIRHVPGGNSGDMRCAIGVYATLMYPGGTTRSRYFTRAQIEAYRKKNRGDTTAASSPWQSNGAEMWQAKAILHTTKDLPQNPRLAQLQKFMDRQEGPVGLDPAREVQPAPEAAALPAGSAATEEAPEEPEQFAPAEEEEPKRMSLGEAEVILVHVQGGAKRMIREFRNTGLEQLLAWARKGLDVDPEAIPLQRIAEASGLVLEARAAGKLKEPPKKAAA